MTKKKKYILISITLLLVLTIFISISYAYWRITHTQNTSNKIATSCFSMELANEKNDITLDSAYPISDEKGRTLTPYSFTITNTCDLFASYTINLEMLEGTTLNSKYIKTMINNEAITNLNTLETTDTSIEGAVESRILFRGSLGAGDSTDYTFRLWMDSDTPAIDEAMNKIFQAKITIIAEVSNYSPVENGFTNLAEALLVNEYQTTNLDVAKNKIASKQSVDFSKTAPLIIWEEQHNTKIQKVSSTKIDASEIGNYGIVLETTQILFGKSYTFDAETGYYTIGDTAYYVPEEVDFSSDDYYYCKSSITVKTDDTITYSDALYCADLYKINGIYQTQESNVSLSDGTNISTNVYTFNVLKYYETEKESDKSDKGLYEAQDDYGTTYYYRGNVTNNIVKFAYNYWYVVRVNGDNSIRLLYYGSNLNSLNKSIGTASFNEISSNPTYAGYMYSNTVNTSYQDTIKNDNDSTIKQVLDSWYKTNILDKGYDSYIADSGFCNDRTLSISTDGDGYSTNKNTHYSIRDRIASNKPSLKCSNIDNDLFTTQNKNLGNKKLSYAIGLLTADELVYGGIANNALNRMSYLSNAHTYWLMTPSYFRAANGSMYNYLYHQDGTFSSTGVTSLREVRPVINLKADTEIIGGIGTKNDPFIVK